MFFLFGTLKKQFRFFRVYDVISAAWLGFTQAMPPGISYNPGITKVNSLNLQYTKDIDQLFQFPPNSQSLIHENITWAFLCRQGPSIEV